MKNDYYVYGLFAEKVCFYVGKGREDRKVEHFRDFKNHNKAVNPLMYNKLRSLQEKKITPYIKVFIENLNEEQALEHEKVIIGKYKRRVDGGTLCNILLGGNQPPSYTELIKIKGKEEVNRIRRQQVEVTAKTIYKKNESKIKQFELLMSQNMMLKDIANELQVTTDTLRRWSKNYKILINHNGKTKRIKEHLQNLRQITKHAVQKTAKTYKIRTPDGSIVTTQKLVSFCRERKLDYSSLRKTFKGRSTHHKQYTIIDQQEPKS